ncbi:hypothetical protein [Kitasatospora sp. NPDC058402]|uniref:hypothetical protein n=1 Tax=Kitasatospora sp. NPDC058402 TaxID=3346481 RepID=UPI0036652A9E
MNGLEEFRAKARAAMDDLNNRVEQDRADTENRRSEEKEVKGLKRARVTLRNVKVGIAVIVAVAAAAASVWDLMRLMEVLGAGWWWGAAAGGAIDLGWIYLLLEVYTHRDAPAKALKHYNRMSALLLLSAGLNLLSGVLSAGHGKIGAIVLGVVSVMMPLMLKAVITPLVLGGSLASELLVTREGRARVKDAAADRHGRALAAYDAGYRLDSERAEHAAAIQLQTQRADFEAERERIALDLQVRREELARAAFEASRPAPAAIAPAVPDASGLAELVAALSGPVSAAVSARLSVPAERPEPVRPDAGAVRPELVKPLFLAPAGPDSVRPDNGGAPAEIPLPAEERTPELVLTAALPGVKADNVAAAVRELRAIGVDDPAALTEMVPVVLGREVNADSLKREIRRQQRPALVEPAPAPGTGQYL